IADERDIGRVTQADANRVPVDLHALGLAGLRIELDIGQAATDDEQRVAFFHGVLGRGRSEQAQAAGRVRTVVGDGRFSEERLDDGSAQQLGNTLELRASLQGAAARQDGNLLAFVQDLGGLLNFLRARLAHAQSKYVVHVAGFVSRRPLVFIELLVLYIDRSGDVRNASAGQSASDGQFRYVSGMCRAHDALVVDGDVFKQLVERHILLRVRSNQVVKLQAGDRQDRLAVHLGVIQAIQQMDSAGAGGGDTNAEFAGEFRVAASHEGSGFFMPYLDEANFVLYFPEGFDKAVDAVSGKSEDCIDAPVHECFYDNIASCFCHARLLLS